MGVSVYDERDPKMWILGFSGPGNFGGLSQQFNAGNGSRVDAMTCFNPDSIAHTFLVEIAAEGSSGFLGTVTVPAGAGSATVPFADILAAFAPAGVGALIFPPGGTIIISQGEDIVDTVVVNITMFGGSL